jgi:hypothetical protein
LKPFRALERGIVYFTMSGLIQAGENEVIIRRVWYEKL